MLTQLVWNIGKQKRKREKGSFTSERTNCVFFFNGHDKLMGFENNTFLIAIYGFLGTTSRKLIWIIVCDSNSSTYRIACWYFDYLYESKLLPHNVMLDLARLQRQEY